MSVSNFLKFTQSRLSYYCLSFSGTSMLGILYPIMFASPSPSKVAMEQYPSEEQMTSYLFPFHAMSLMHA